MFSGLSVFSVVHPSVRLAMRHLLSLALLLSVCVSAKEFTVEYPPSKEPGELVFGVTYTMWVPDNVATIRGVIVHQHGCGEGACKGGATAAYDLHWQALAKKWDCALLGPSYHQPEKENCRLWCDPRNGSSKTFLRALAEIAKQSNHAEIETAPWCLWGHSGGGYWASILQTMYPERIVAIWFRSGTAFNTWGKNNVPAVQLTDAVYQIPMVCNPGAKENGDKRFNGAWVDAIAMFKAYREKGAPISVAPDPRTGHECGDSRYLAIPFFDACLALRLPEKGVALKPIDQTKSFLAPLLGDAATSAAEFKGEAKEANWLPNEAVAKAWSEYVKTGSTADTTPPPAPAKVSAKPSDAGVEIAWEPVCDFESGILQFVIERDGAEIGRVPAQPKGNFGRPLYQRMSFHDTPEAPMPEPKFIDKTAKPGEKAVYRVTTINSVGLKSEPAVAQ